MIFLRGPVVEYDFVIYQEMKMYCKLHEYFWPKKQGKGIFIVLYIIIYNKNDI